jgi:HlyD family secretion protein
MSDQASPRAGFSIMKGLAAATFIVGILGSAGLWYMGSGQVTTTTFRTTTVERGNLLASVTATGTLEPVEAIDVGAQVAGQIKSFGTDPDGKPIDFGSIVEPGTILAKLDDSIYLSQVGQARANVLKAEADLGQLRAKLNKAERDWNRIRRLMTSKGVVADAEHDLAQSDLETAKASLQVGEAAVAQAREVLKQAETNLSYTTIRSPVKGVILDRRVNVGQTVVASLNAPSLFLIATDLSKLQIWASVNEADIGQIHPGQQVRFTVDAFPGDNFSGVVSQIRLNAMMTMNVVTYTVVVDTDNSNRKLLPYMTANLQFLIGERRDVLLVPNSALRWRPQRQQVAEDARDDYDRHVRRKSASTSSTARPTEQHLVWVPAEKNLVRPVLVRVGLSDGTTTEITGGDLAEGQAVVIGLSIAATPADNSINPFAPVVPTSSRGRSR